MSILCYRVFLTKIENDQLYFLILKKRFQRSQIDSKLIFGQIAKILLDTLYFKLCTIACLVCFSATYYNNYCKTLCSEIQGLQIMSKYHCFSNIETILTLLGLYQTRNTGCFTRSLDSVSNSDVSVNSHSRKLHVRKIHCSSKM